MNEFIKEQFVLGIPGNSNSEPNLNVSYGIDKNFLYGAGVSIASVLLNNTDLKFCFHIFTDYIDEDYLSTFRATAEQFDTKIIIYLIDPIFFSNLPTSQFWSYATYFRILSFEYLSKNISTLLYLDADVICKGSLKKIAKINFIDEYAAVIPDNDDTQYASAKRLDIPDFQGFYFNAGVIYVNLKKWHSSNLTPILISLLRGESKFGYLKYLDQDALNIAFNKNNIYLSSDYNKIYSLKNELKDNSHQKYMQTISNETVLIHYTGITKPWHLWARYPAAKYFLEAATSTPWKKYPLKDARNKTEMQKKYKHLIKQRRFISGLVSLIEYKLAKRK